MAKIGNFGLRYLWDLEGISLNHKANFVYSQRFESCRVVSPFSELVRMGIERSSKYIFRYAHIISICHSGSCDSYVTTRVCRWHAQTTTRRKVFFLPQHLSANYILWCRLTRLFSYSIIVFAVYKSS